MSSLWKKAAEKLTEGGLVVLPSESSYGLAALVSSNSAVSKLYRIKKRSDKKPSLIIVGSLAQAEKLVIFSSLAKTLASKFWPGGLTLVLESRDKSLPKTVYGENLSLAIRLPGHQDLRDLALLVGPFILPSANFNGEKPPFELEEIDKNLISLVDYLLPEKPHKNPVSTLVDARGEQAIILRQGSVQLF